MWSFMAMLVRVSHQDELIFELDSFCVIRWVAGMFFCGAL